MSYKEFSYFYDYFNYNADYDALFEKILELAKEGGVKNGIVCDLGCGTGELAFRFNDAGFDVIAVDYSDEMLDVLFDKRDELEAYEIQILKQDITQLDMFGTVDYQPSFSVQAISDAIIDKTGVDENEPSYNIGGFNEWKNIDLIKVMIKTVDRILGNPEGHSLGLITYVTDRLGHDARYAIDSTKLQRELGWEPSLQFEEGIEKTVKWYLENEAWLDNITSGAYERYYEEQYSNR